MPWGESKAWRRGTLQADYFRRLMQDATERPARNTKRKRIVTPEEMPWELSPHGLLKHIINDAMGTMAETIDIYMQVIPPGSRSGRHRHFAEEAFYIAEGSGYDLHWDCDVEADEQGWRWIVPDEPQRFEWKAGDVVYIPPATMHQHFNGEGGRPARIISATNRVYKWSGLNNLEQLENAPEYDRGVSLRDLLDAVDFQVVR